VIVGGRFSKSSDERENILDERKRSLIDVHRRRYLASPRGIDLRRSSTDDDIPSSSSIVNRRDRFD